MNFLLGVRTCGLGLTLHPGHPGLISPPRQLLTTELLQTLDSHCISWLFCFFNPLSLQEWRQTYRCLPTYCCVLAHHHPRTCSDPSKSYRTPLSQGLWAFTLLASSDPTFPAETNALNLCYLTTTNPRPTEAIFRGLPPAHSSYSRTTGFLLSPA